MSQFDISIRSSVFPLNETYSKLFSSINTSFCSLLCRLCPFAQISSPTNLYHTYLVPLLLHKVRQYIQTRSLSLLNQLPQLLSFCSPDITTKGAHVILTSFFCTDYRAPEVIVLFARQTVTHRRLSVTQRCP